MQGGESLLQDICRRVGEAGVDVAEFFQAEEIRGVSRTVEVECGGEVYGGRTGVGRGLVTIACTEGQGTESGGLLSAHVFLSFFLGGRRDRGLFRIIFDSCQLSLVKLFI